jgi:hypothetical protein
MENSLSIWKLVLSFLRYGQGRNGLAVRDGLDVLGYLLQRTVPARHR